MYLKEDNVKIHMENQIYLIYLIFLDELKLNWPFIL